MGFGWKKKLNNETFIDLGKENGFSNVGTHNPLYYKFKLKKPVIASSNPKPATEIKEDGLYWEKDDVNPNQIIYDLENNKTIIPNSEDDITDTSESVGR